MRQVATHQLFQRTILVSEVVFLELWVRLTVVWFPVEVVFASEPPRLRWERIDALVVDAKDVCSMWVYFHCPFC